MSLPLVSVICICYNHEQFVEEAIQSVLQQTYANVEVIVIDDASADRSRSVIEKLKQTNPQLIVSYNESNRGNCYSFNKGLAMAGGKYIIDLATDDVMIKDRIENQVHFFESQPDKVGVVHSNAIYFAGNKENGNHFYDVVKSKPAQGNVFKKLLSSYNVCPPTMMIKKVVLDELGGYDEALAYEDFDFWVRSSRNWEYAYQDMVTTYKRVVPNSLSNSFEQISPIHESTVRVCKKAANMIETIEEKEALKKRINYEWRSALKRKDKKIVEAYESLSKGLTINKEWKTFLMEIYMKLRK